MDLKIKKFKNNCFCEEKCCLCRNWFDAGDYIYECLFGYVCYGCINKIKKKENGQKRI